MKVKAWAEKIIIPTYAVGLPDKNPMFFEKRVYQGSSGVVYPNPIIEKIYDEKEDKEYLAVFLENNFLKIMILPELGGRVQMAYDKIRNRHFIYYNQVIKPALVGLCGPWISGGIEFNWPQHHRPSTFEPVDYDIQENEDGSITVWVNETEKMFHTKGMAGFTLHPDYAYLEIKAKVSNPTSLPQTFLWWANPAVKVNDHYQSVFPPDVNAVFDHGKRDVSTFPIATGVYYKVDYSPGTDISMYKNIPVPTSYMAVNSSYDFVGGYDHDTRAGMLHVADHHVSPGKKQWTWGNSDFGIAWDRNLTDEDGPYIELMTGVFTDNQPDFTWLMPFEEKTFTQYFLPYGELGLVKNATKDMLLSMETAAGMIHLKLYATTRLAGIIILIYDNEEVLFEANTTMNAGEVIAYKCAPEQGFDANNVAVKVTDRSGKLLLSYAVTAASKKIPTAAEPVPAPGELATAEQLYLAGQHLEQYRHATLSPVPYYKRALQLDVGDIRNNNALGLWFLRRGKFSKSEEYFKTAVMSLTKRNPNPYDGEPSFNLGLSLWYQGRTNEAYDAFFKSTWNGAWQDSGYYYIAKIDLLRADNERALEHINWSIDRNARNGKAYLIKIQALRRLGKTEQALQVAAAAIERDKFNYAVLFAQSLCYRECGEADISGQVLNLLRQRSRSTTHNLIETAIEFMEIGCYNEAISILQLATEPGAATPLINYYLAFLLDKTGDNKSCKEYLVTAAKCDPGTCFPNRLQDILVLEHAALLNPGDSKIPYYLGNLFYDKRQYNEAIDFWKRSYALNPRFPTVNRNLGIALFNKINDHATALQHYETAFSLDNTDARILMELDQLYKRLNKAPAERCVFLEENLEIVLERDDVYLELIYLYNLLGKTDLAYDLLIKRKFHPWEGGEGKVSGQYIYSLTEIAKRKLKEGDYEKAIELLTDSLIYPENLSEGRLPNARDNDISFWLGCAYYETGDKQKATTAWNLATVGNQQPGAAIFYNDSPPDKIFYQALAFFKLGDNKQAHAVLNSLITYGETHINDPMKMDYFAVSLPDLMAFESDLNERNKIHCMYLIGLGNLGLRNFEKAAHSLKNVFEKEAVHAGAKIHLDLLLDNNLNALVFKNESLNPVL